MSEKCEYCESEPLEGECQCPGAQIARLTAELNEAWRELGRMGRGRGNMKPTGNAEYDGETVGQFLARSELAELRAERDALAGALKKIAKYDFDVNLQPAAAAMREIAVDTLAAHREK